MTGAAPFSGSSDSRADFQKDIASVPNPAAAGSIRARRKQFFPWKAALRRAGRTFLRKPGAGHFCLGSGIAPATNRSSFALFDPGIQRDDTLQSAPRLTQPGGFERGPFSILQVRRH